MKKSNLKRVASKSKCVATQNGTLDKFFKKIRRHENNNTSDAMATTSFLKTSAFATTNWHSQSYQPDIGTYIKKNTVDDFIKVDLLQKHWVPSQDYVFPHSKNKKKRKQEETYIRKQLKKLDWLVLSHEDKGLYCKYCAIQYFQTELYSGLLVTVALKDFDDLSGRNGVLLKHQRDQSHKDALEMGKQFILGFQSSNKTQVNKEWLRPSVVKTIIFGGHQSLPLRCYMDNVKLLEDQKIEGNNDSFLSSAEEYLSALLNYREGSVHTSLKPDLEVVESDATYVSETIQSKIMNVCREIIQESILENVKKAKYFSILIDEAIDITSHSTQLCLSVRYLHNKIIAEDFLTYCNAEKMFSFDEQKDYRYEKPLSMSVGVALAQFVENIFNTFDVDLKWCVGIGIDNCSAMSPEIKNTVVQELSKRALYVKRCPSSNYILNNSLALTSCRNASTTMRQVVEFASATTEMQPIFGGIFKMRWDEMHNGYEAFQGDNLIKICSALEKISEWQENKAAFTAYGLLQALHHSDFIMSSLFLNDILGVTEHVSKQLQMPTSAANLKRATAAIKDAKNVLRNKREHAIEVFSELFQKGKQVTEQLGGELRCPGVVSHETNPQIAEKYYYTEVYIPLLDSVINDLEDRLSSQVIDLFQLGVFLPERSSNVNESDVNASVKRLACNYLPLIDNATKQTIENQYKLWITHWQNNDIMLLTLSEIIEVRDEEMYPMIQAFLNILASLPVSVTIK